MAAAQRLKRVDRIAFYMPAALLLAIVLAYPIARTVFLSLFHVNLATGFRPVFAGVGNFQRLLYDSRFLNTLKVTGIFTIVSVTLEFGFGLLLALAAERLIRGRGLVRSVLLAPWTLPTAVIAVLWTWIFNDQYGVVNALLAGAHIIERPITWLGAPVPAMAAVVIADVWKTTPFVFLVLLAGMQNVPGELYDAMEVDGGGAWAKFRHVTWPFLLPYVFIALTFRMIQAFAVFDLVYVMTGGGPAGATETVSVYTYRTYMRYLDIGYGSALAVATVVLLAAASTGLYRLVLRPYARRL
jgi:multiple sugar transport system permease protein